MACAVEACTLSTSLLDGGVDASHQLGDGLGLAAQSGVRRRRRQLLGPLQLAVGELCAGLPDQLLGGVLAASQVHQSPVIGLEPGVGRIEFGPTWLALASATGSCSPQPLLLHCS